MLYYTNIVNRLKCWRLTSQIYKLFFNVGIFQHKKQKRNNNACLYKLIRDIRFYI
jgi:hypothetical protein